MMQNTVTMDQLPMCWGRMSVSVDYRGDFRPKWDILKADF